MVDGRRGGEGGDALGVRKVRRVYLSFLRSPNALTHERWSGGGVADPVLCSGVMKERVEWGRSRGGC